MHMTVCGLERPWLRRLTFYDTDHEECLDSPMLDNGNDYSTSTLPPTEHVRSPEAHSEGVQGNHNEPLSAGT